MVVTRSLLVGLVATLLLTANVSADVLWPRLKWGPTLVGSGTQSAYYLNDTIVNGNVIGARIDYGPYEQDRYGAIVHALATSPTATAKSAVRVGDYVYFTGNSGGVYRTQVANTATPWTTFTACTISNSKPLETLATDGTTIYASSTAANDQIHAYTVNPSTGELNLQWSTSGIAGRTRGLDWDASGYLYAADGGGTTETQANNAARLYAINATTGTTTDLGQIAFNGRQYAVVRDGNLIYVADSYTGTSPDVAKGQIYVYELATDTSLLSNTPVATFDPAAINSIYGAAIDGNFLWLTSGGGATYGFELVPEPATVVLLGLGVLGLVLYRRRAR